MTWKSIARRTQSLMPRRLVVPARLLAFRTRALLYRGDAVQCPCCSRRFSRFLDVGLPPRAAACPGCDSRERQRLLYLYLRNETNLFSDPLRVLHIAPEDCLQAGIAGSPNVDYVSADISSSAAMMRMDVTDIRLPDGSFDVILCSHVLEHVGDDGRAMRELRRVLRPGGWAILQVPLDESRENTFEDPAVTDPAARERLFGQWDHVRVYGRDYPQRLANAGFDVQVIPYATRLGPDAIRTCGLDTAESIHLCRKPT
jgi:SAM-dependent methyltransferase